MVNSKKQVSGVIFTDLHIKENNIEQSKSLISQLIELTLKHNLDKVVILLLIIGGVFFAYTYKK